MPLDESFEQYMARIDMLLMMEINSCTDEVPEYPYEDAYNHGYPVEDVVSDIIGMIYGE